MILIVALSLCLLTACGDNNKANNPSGNNTSTNSTSGNNTSTNSTSGTKVKSFCEIVSEITGSQVLTAADAPYYFTIGSDDSYCVIDTNPYDIDDFTSSTALRYIEEMNKELGLPEYLYNDMLNTSYSQGKQEETFEKIKVRYYYHPDKGLNVTYYRI